MTKASYEICLNLKLYQTLFLNRGDKITGDPEISRPTSRDRNTWNIFYNTTSKNP